MKLKDVKVGDMIVIQPLGYSPLIIAPVTIVTETQIITTKYRFNRRNGVRIGDGNCWRHRIEIKRNSQTLELMTPEEAEKINIEIKLEQEKREIINLILGTPRAILLELPIETLRQIIDLMVLK